jgi:hypothetical protein
MMIVFFMSSGAVFGLCAMLSLLALSVGFRALCTGVFALVTGRLALFAAGNDDDDTLCLRGVDAFSVFPSSSFRDFGDDDVREGGDPLRVELLLCVCVFGV